MGVLWQIWEDCVWVLVGVYMYVKLGLGRVGGYMDL